MLLTSVAFAVGVVRLGQVNVLVQELLAVEGLARRHPVPRQDRDAHRGVDRGAVRRDDRAGRGRAERARRDRGRGPEPERHGASPKAMRSSLNPDGRPRAQSRSRRHASGARLRSRSRARGSSALPTLLPIAERRRRRHGQGAERVEEQAKAGRRGAPRTVGFRFNGDSPPADLIPARSSSSKQRSAPTPPRRWRTSPRRA